MLIRTGAFVRRRTQHLGFRLLNLGLDKLVVMRYTIAVHYGCSDALGGEINDMQDVSR